MRRKGSKNKNNEKSEKSEKKRLLKEKETEENSEDSKNLQPRTEKPDRRKSVWAPAATATNFEDVPVLTICPYCCQKVVTKTHFKRGRKNWLVF